MATQLKTKWIGDLQVTNPKIADNAVDSTKIDANSIGDGLSGGSGSILAIQSDGTTLTVGASGVKVADSGIGPLQMGTDSVNSDAIQAQAVGASELGSVAGNGLAGGAGSVLAVQADGTTLSVGVSGVKVADSGIGPLQLQTNAVGTPEIQNAAVTNEKIADGAVDSTAIDTNTIGDGLAGGAGSAISVQADGTTISVSSSGVKVGDLSITNNQISASAGIELTKLEETVLQADGGQELTADWNVGGNYIVTGLPTPTIDADSANKKYVDDQISSAGTAAEWQDSAISYITTPPGGESTGDRYLIDATATGAWVGKENDIAEWDTTSWEYTTPTTGTYISVDDQTDGLYYYGGSAWTKKYFESLTAGDGLVRSGNTFNVGAGDGIAVGTDDVTVNIDGTTLSKTASGVKVADSGIGPLQLATGAVGTPEIQGSAVTTAKIADDAVDENKIVSSAIGDGLKGGSGSVVAAEADTTGGAGLLAVIDVNSNGIALNAATDPGLEEDGTNRLRVKVKVDGGLVLDSDGLSLDQGSVNALKIEEYTVQAADVTSKSFTLSDTMADTGQLSLTILGGVLQNYGVDYTAGSATTVSWSGLGLDGFVDEGEEIQVTYPI